jgi:hypothetical protein
MQSSLGNDSSSVLEDILGIPTRTDTKDKASNTHPIVEPSAPPVDFGDDLLPGFGGTEPARTWYVWAFSYEIICVLFCFYKMMFSVVILYE